METKLSLLSEKNKQLFANSMNEIHDLKLSFDEWISEIRHLNAKSGHPSDESILESLNIMVDFYYGIETQEKINQQ